MIRWLSAQGIRLGMLYVDADNVSAVRLYERLGFVVAGLNASYVRAG